MNVTGLIRKLDEIGVPKRDYSINGDLLPDTHFLNQVYGKWEYFYFDEKGNKEDYRMFDNESDACKYMLGMLENEIKYS